jgi:hypothetical protein
LLGFVNSLSDFLKRSHVLAEKNRQQPKGPLGSRLHSSFDLLGNIFSLALKVFIKKKIIIKAKQQQQQQQKLV